ncbi:MAG: hypothetical protein A2002_08120 [Pseudomonadales bacterium GWC1_66_9]|nr:MAG: hypothetical protein A2002_08120 [Pseudomonadales bacterium GWC1_66_9]
MRGGLASIGMVSRSLNPDEQDLTSFLIANDGITMIVHADNPLVGYRPVPACWRRVSSSL